MKYSLEKNVQILISLLKQHNIKKIIASPGATNISFVASVQNDDYFEIYSCVDERSAAYLACGMAAKSNEPVVLSCTGATASRNYTPALTEAFYRKLPIIAITSTQNISRIGQGIAQVIDRSVIQKDIAKISVFIPTVRGLDDRWRCNLNINNALLECRRNGGGPVHINLETDYNNDYSVELLPKERMIERIINLKNVPKINYENVAIFINQHAIISDELTFEIELFCENYNGVVLCDQTSNYNGKYKIFPNLICNQESDNSYLKNISLLIEIGNVSGSYTNIIPSVVWRVNPDGEIRDRFKKLQYVFEMEEIDFFKKYNEKNIIQETTYYSEWNNEYNRLLKKIEVEKIPFSNIWIANKLINKLPDNSEIHLAILNTLRSWNYFNSLKKFSVYSNTGGFGIDGIVSTMIGSSYIDKNKNVFAVVGDLAFFYDMNSLGLRDINNNIRLMVINNGCGTEFHNYNHRASAIGEKVGKYVAADSHNGNKSNKLLKDYAENLGFIYISANSKEDFNEKIDIFVQENLSNSVVFEVFTNYDDESNALKIINNLEINNKIALKKIVKSYMKKFLPSKLIKK